MKKINAPIFILLALIVSYVLSGGIVAFWNRDYQVDPYSEGIIFFILIGLFFLSFMAFRFLNKAVGIAVFGVAIIFTAVQIAKKAKNSNRVLEKKTIKGY